MDARRSPLAVSLVILGLIASAARAQAFSAQETADREGDQSGMIDAEVAPPLAYEEPGTPAKGAFLDDESIQGILGDGNWGVEIVLIEPTGRTEKLSGLNENREMMPASTMKVFTSWFGFVKTEELEAEGRAPVFPTPWKSYEAYAAYTLKVSDNDMAKAILKRFAPLDGPAVLEDFYAALGLARKEDFKVVDGAGLATGNRATAHLEVSLLSYIFNSEHYKSYREMLAEPGETGTLRRRLPGLKGSLYAKTGTLTRTRVAALTGFLDMGNSGTVVFSIIGNNPKLPVDVQRARIDEVVETLSRGVVAANRGASDDAALVALRRRDIGGMLANLNPGFQR